MKTYFINNGNENGGPFTIEELSKQEISKATLVWHLGMDDWKYATEIEELSSFFITIPPVLRTENSSSVSKNETKTFFGFKKSHLLLSILFLIILSIIITLNVIQNNKRSLLDEKNKQTEQGNERIKLEQKVSFEQRIQDDIQKKIVEENTNNRKKDSINNRINEVRDLLIDNKNKLATAENDLINSQQFKLLRSESAKEQQITDAQKNISYFKNEVDKLENESNRLYLILETIH